MHVVVAKILKEVDFNTVGLTTNLTDYIQTVYQSLKLIRYFLIFVSKQATLSDILRKLGMFHFSQFS